MNHYPKANLFRSPQWQARLNQLGLDSAGFKVHSKYGLSVGLRALQFLEDFETWPDIENGNFRDTSDSATGADLLFFRKLIQEDRPAKLPVGTLCWSSTVSPYLDLESDLKFNTHEIANILRRERNLIKTMGPVVLSEATASEQTAWFSSWIDFLTARWKKENHPILQPAGLKIMRQWLLGAPLPPWIKLFSLSTSETPLCRCLAYVSDGVFYFQIPGMNPDSTLRRFGIGKLFVHKLINWSLENRLKTFDFLQGDEDYKFAWNPKVRHLTQCEIPLTLRGRIFLATVRRLQIAYKMRLNKNIRILR